MLFYKQVKRTATETKMGLSYTKILISGLEEKPLKHCAFLYVGDHKWYKYDVTTYRKRA